MPEMIDWVQCELPLVQGKAINRGYVHHVAQNGALERKYMKWVPVDGDHGISLRVRSGPNVRSGHNSLEVSGNLARFLQGHNLFGPSDLIALVLAAVARLERYPDLDMGITEQDRESWSQGEFRLNRVDIARMYDLETTEQVRQWLRAASSVAHDPYQKTSMIEHETLYIGQNSRRGSLKIYDKAREMRDKPLPHYLDRDSSLANMRSQFRAYAEGKLRVEVVMRSMNLKYLNLDRAAAWQDMSVPATQLNNRIARLRLPDTVAPADEIVQFLPQRLMRVYTLWRAGEDLRELYSPQTIRRHRKDLLERGIDIKYPVPRTVGSELSERSLASFLEGDGAPLPSWAKGTPLLVCAA